jgi:hypothetical protein
MADNGNGTHNVWKVIGGVGVVVGLFASFFSAGMNYARNSDNSDAIRVLNQQVQSEYMRQDTADLRFQALQYQLDRIERAVGAK